MLDRQHSSFGTMSIVILDGIKELRYLGPEAVIKMEEMVEKMIHDDMNFDSIGEAIDNLDSTDSVYSQFRCFYLAVSFIQEYLSEINGFDKSERYKYYKALINFTEYSQIRVMAMYLQFMFNKYENVNMIRNNKEFEIVFVDCGLGFDVYKN